MDKNKKRILFKLIPAGFLALLLLILTIMLFNILTAPGAKEYEAERKLTERNTQYSKGNSFGFTDKERTPHKPKGIYRIAVIGDSFIWGSGLPYEDAWSHKLEKKMLAEYDSVEVIHWGTCGWSTQNEFDFYKQHGKDYNVDLLIIGWVDNDPDMGIKVKPKNPAIEYPRLNKYWPALAKRWVDQKAGDEYSNWLDNLYSHQNLVEYKKLLINFHEYLKETNTPTLFVMTPSPFYDELKRRFDTMEPVIRSAGFRCLNLYEPSEKKLGHYSLKQLNANPVNGHPGVLMTEEFALEVKDYLEANHYLAHLHKK